MNTSKVNFKILTCLPTKQQNFFFKNLRQIRKEKGSKESKVLSRKRKK